MQYISSFLSPLGRILLASDAEWLTGLWFEGQKHYGAGLEACPVRKDTPVICRAKSWLELYFTGRDPGPFQEVSLRGTPFQNRVWTQLQKIPYGEIITYGELSEKVTGKRTAARAVGAAVGRNPVSIIVPCHRVTGNGGRLTGYAGGLDRKSALLMYEKAGPAAENTIQKNNKT